MARSRSIKPGFFSNDALVELSFEYRLLFVGLWTIADKEGRLLDRPKKIKMEIFPADDVDCGAGLSQLESKGFLVRYEISGIKYIQILNWKKHQSPHIKEADSVLPGIPELAPEIPERAALTPSSLTPDSPFSDCGLRTADTPSAPPVLADRKILPEGEMAIALRDLGVLVRSTDPVLHAWLRDGFTVQQVTDSVGIARIRKPHPERIHANYLDPILRAPQRAPPNSAERITWRPPPDEEEVH